MVYEIDYTSLAQVLRDTPNLVSIDVRTEQEYAAGALEGSLNVNMMSADFALRIQKLAERFPETNWLVYCRSGHRSAHVMPQLLSILPGNIYHLTSGIAGVPLVSKI